MSETSRKELDARIRELLKRSDELFQTIRYQSGLEDFDHDENLYVLMETERLIAELRRRGENETSTDSKSRAPDEGR